MVNLRAIGKNLRRLRLQQGLTLAQLSGLTSVSPVTVHNIEKGLYEPKISTLIDLCSALNVPIDQFIRPKVNDLFLKIPDESESSSPRTQKPAYHHSPQISRIELFRVSEITLEDSGGQAISIYLVFGRLEVRCGNNIAQLMPGDALHLETYQDIIISAQINSLVIRFTELLGTNRYLQVTNRKF